MTKEDLREMVEEMDFMEDATNVYRTENYIVKQKISIEVIEASTVVFSKDTFYARTRLRDAQYEFVFAFKKERLNGKRVPSTMTTRIYVD